MVVNLNVTGMLLSRRLARAIADAGMLGFHTEPDFMCRWYGWEYVMAGRWFPSSKLCSDWGWKNDDLTIFDGEWWCGGGGVLNDRDGKATKNLANWPGLSFPAFRRRRMETV